MVELAVPACGVAGVAGAALMLIFVKLMLKINDGEKIVDVVRSDVIGRSRVAIIGGSIAGCAAAIALSRAGCEVTVFERSRGSLADRGFGIGMPLGLHGELASVGYLDDRTPYVRYLERVWLVPGGPPAGRELARQPFALACENWSVLWQGLRAKIPDAAYLSGVSVLAIEPGEGGAVVTTTAGEQRFDVVVGADGYQSLVRRYVSPGSEIVPSGYAIWRGSYPERLLPAATIRQLSREAAFFHFRQGHGGAYLIPDPAGAGDRLVNCSLYLGPGTRLTSLALKIPGTLSDHLKERFSWAIESELPRFWGVIMGKIGWERLSVQPVYDVTVTRYTSGRLALIGDAGAAARPHTASGASTALQDALALERYCRRADTWEEALQRYDRERCVAGNAQTELGRRLGEALVLNTPDWAAMRPDDFSGWWSAVLSGNAMLY